MQADYPVKQKELLEILHEASLFKEVEDEVITLHSGSVCGFINATADDGYLDPMNTLFWIGNFLWIDPTVDIETADNICADLSKKYSPIVTGIDWNDDEGRDILETYLEISNNDELIQKKIIETIRKFELILKKLKYYLMLIQKWNR